MEHIDFTGCRRILGKAYNGANGKKIAVEYEGDIYMLKFPPSAGNKPVSYTHLDVYKRQSEYSPQTECPH